MPPPPGRWAAGRARRAAAADASPARRRRWCAAARARSPCARRAVDVGTAAGRPRRRRRAVGAAAAAARRATHAAGRAACVPAHGRGPRACRRPSAAEKKCRCRGCSPTGGRGEERWESQRAVGVCARWCECAHVRVHACVAAARTHTVVHARTRAVVLMLQRLATGRRTAGVKGRGHADCCAWEPAAEEPQLYGHRCKVPTSGEHCGGETGRGGRAARQCW